MEQVKDELIKISKDACKRLATRIEDLTDDEYFWEPAPNSWTVRADDDGKSSMQFGVIFDETPPLTTIAWRLTHIIDLLSEERCATWIGLSPEPENLFVKGAPSTAQAARELLTAAEARWERYVSATDADALFAKLGPIARQFSESTRMGFILHIIDELIHHAAEVALLRDLYRARSDEDPIRSVLLSGDRAAIDALGKDAIEAAPATYPDLVLYAAATARWDAIPVLIDLGFDTSGRDGRTPLHHAAAGGQIALMQKLIEMGSDLSVRDPVYRATPIEWAEFFGRSEAADLLRSTGA